MGGRNKQMRLRGALWGGRQHSIVLLEYFAGEKLLRMNQISRKFDPLRSNYCVLTIAFWQGSCVFTSND